MAHQHDDQREGEAPAHNHNCGGLFGCGDEKGTGVVREDIKDGAFDKRAADRLLHRDEVEQERLDGFLSARGRARRQLLRASSFMGALAAVGPWFGKLAQAAGSRRYGRDRRPGAAAASMSSTRTRRRCGSGCSMRPCRRF